MNHRVLERPQEVLLELEVGQLLLLQEAHGKLPQSIEGEEADVNVLVTADLASQVRHSPYPGAHTRLTWLKCSPRISHIFDHSRRIRFML